MRYLLRGMLTLIAFLMCLPTLAQTRYSIIKLAIPAGYESASVQGINNRGQVVGSATRADLTPYYHETTHAILWDPIQGIKDLGTLGGSNSKAASINNLGQVTGQSETNLVAPTGQVITHAFLWDPLLGMQDVTPPSGYLFGFGFGINDLGQIAGQAIRILGPNASVAVRWDSPTSARNLGTLGTGDSSSYALGINNLGHVVGQSGISVRNSFGYFPYHAFLWDSVHGMRDLGSLAPAAGNYSEAKAVNDLDQVVGWTETPEDGPQAFLWTEDAGMQNLGVLPIPGGGGSSAVAINNATQVVGGSIIRGGLGRAFLWDRAHGMVDLNFLIPGGNGFVMLGALGINAQGQIIAAGNDNNDPITNGPPNSVFLLTPNPPALTFAVDKTAQVRVSRSGFRGNYASFTLFQTLTLKNVGSTPIQGPISVVLDGLDPATLVANRSAATNYIAPLYSQYINANLGPGNRLAPGASVNVRPQFLPYGDLFYSTRILAGPGAR